MAVCPIGGNTPGEHWKILHLCILAALRDSREHIRQLLSPVVKQGT